ncbi:MAG: hypothetical protein AB1Z98_22365 [Nannocystaceae bacterium]
MDEVARLELRAVAEQDVDETDSVARPRVREQTAPRRHVFLPQTVPPLDPLVREVERRRSGRGDDV